MSAPEPIDHVDALLIGAGIMSATVATLLKALDPSLRIVVFERLTRVAGESSDARNNAGTGHAALCELNYTPQRDDGTVDIAKAVQVMERFEVSKQLWASLVERGLTKPGTFIRSVPHVSFVRGDDDVRFLRARWEALRENPLFQGMEYSEDPATLSRWMPLVMEGRAPSERVAATRSELGTDVDFGALTRAMFARLAAMPGFELHLDHEVRALSQNDDRTWSVRVHDEELDAPLGYRARFVFIGAGQRVQVIKKDDDLGGRLEFGTEIVSARDNTLAALLGASPGASTSVSIALDLLVDCFPERMADPAWRASLAELVPSWGAKLSEDPALAARVRARCAALLGLSPD